MKKERREKMEAKEAQMRRVANLEALMEEYYKKGRDKIFSFQSVLQLEIKLNMSGRWKVSSSDLSPDTDTLPRTAGWRKRQ